MPNLFTIFWAELKRYFRVQWSHLGDSVSWFVMTLLILVAILVVFQGANGGSLGRTTVLLVAIGWVTYSIITDCYTELPVIVMEEAQTGTLEQLALTPVPFPVLIAIRGAAYTLGAGLRGVVLAIVLLVLVLSVPLGSTLLGLFFISLIGAFGMGFFFAGLALILKQIEAITNLVFSLMLFLTGAFVSLEKLGWGYDLLRIAFPMTWGISLMRAFLSGKTIPSTDLLGITLHSLIYLAFGLAVFFWGYRFARQKGTLAQY